MTILKQIQQKGKMKIHQIKDRDRKVQNDKTKILTIIQKYYIFYNLVNFSSK